MTQTVDLTPSAALIDAGLVTADMSAYLGGYLNQNDYSELTYEFRDTSGGALHTAHFAPVKAADRGNASGFVKRAETIPVPPQARSVLITANFVRYIAPANDGYLDNISLVLDAPPGELQVTHTSDTTTPVSEGDEVTYTTTLTNTGKQRIDVDHVLVMSGVLDDADLLSGPTSSDGAITVSPTGADRTLTGSLEPGQSVTVTFKVKTKPYAEQGDHQLVSAVTEAGSAPGQTPGSCDGLALCTDVPSADTAAVPLVNPVVGGVAAATALAAGGVFVLARRRKTTA